MALSRAASGPSVSNPHQLVRCAFGPSDASPRAFPALGDPGSSGRAGPSLRPSGPELPALPLLPSLIDARDPAESLAPSPQALPSAARRLSLPVSKREPARGSPEFGMGPFRACVAPRTWLVRPLRSYCGTNRCFEPRLIRGLLCAGPVPGLLRASAFVSASSRSARVSIDRRRVLRASSSWLSKRWA